MPVTLESLIVFTPIALALNLTPGADMMFCLGQGMKAGPRAGIAASVGIAAGGFIHTVLAGLGLAALIAAYPIAFEVIRWSGVAYLLWLAFSAFRNGNGIHLRDTSPDAVGKAQPRTGSAFTAWRNGVVVCFLNPKVAVFILALVPQFVDPATGSTFLQFLIFGAILNLGGTVINAIVGGFAGRIGATLMRSRRASNALRMVSGTIFLGLAIRLAFDRK